ncbi:MAG: putative signal transducing protein [Bacteroidales bacterium]
MSKFITIATFSNLNSGAVLRSLLESQDIECRFNNEATTQIFGGYANIGYAELQVIEEQLQEALEIMKENGYRSSIGKSDNNTNPMLESLERISSRIPILRHLKLEYRIIMILIALAVAIGLLLSWLFTVDGVPY